MNFFNKKNYKKLLFIPFVFLIIFIFIIAFFGLEKGMDFKGGTQIIVHYEEDKDYSNLETSLLENNSFTEVKINEIKSLNSYGLIIEFSLQKDLELAKAQKEKLDFTAELETLKTEITSILNPLVEKDMLTQNDISFISHSRNKEDLKQGLSESLTLAHTNFYNQINLIVKKELNLEQDAKIQTREIAPTLGKDFVKTSIKVGIVAFVLIISIILLFFKEIVPSILIIFAVVFDVLAALTGMILFKIPLSLTTLPGLLMLIGYAVDTNILLTARVLKEKGDYVFEAANRSLKTGLTMTTTTVTTVILMLVISYFTQMFVIFEIAAILLCGLLGDLIATWLFNTPSLLIYVFKKTKS